ncbi:MAG TPA: hypothetical protein VF059_13770 [Casimicrobiaceae bacterium]
MKDSSLDVTDEFHAKELDEVILAQGITTRDEYRLVRRAGRGIVLGRTKRDSIWPVFEEYRAQLASRKLKEVDDACRDAASVPERGGKPLSYSAIPRICSVRSRRRPTRGSSSTSR